MNDGRAMRRREVLEIIRKNRDIFRKLGVKRLGLFGSVARDEANDESDVDILVEFEEGKKNFDNFMELAFILDEIFKVDVDLLTIESLDPQVRSAVEKEVIYEEIS